eukprot:962318-Pyramimonas_sp.AAC.1
MPPFHETASEKASALTSLLRLDARQPVARDPSTSAASSCQLWVAAANVLSLSPGTLSSSSAKPSGLFLSGRMKQLSSAFSRHHFFLIGTVETRFPRSGVSTVAPYHIIHSEADEPRRFGCSLWINTTTE